MIKSSLVNSTWCVLGWPGTSNSVDICETLEDWTTDLSFISDSDEDDDVLLVRNSYARQNRHSKVCAGVTGLLNV